MTNPATDARTAPVAVWQVLEKMNKEEREAWRVASIANLAPAEQRNLDIGFPFGWYPFMLGHDLAVGEVVGLGPALDAVGADFILIEALPGGPGWRAVADRLGRAAVGSGGAEA